MPSEMERRLLSRLDRTGAVEVNAADMKQMRAELARRLAATKRA